MALAPPYELAKLCLQNGYDVLIAGDRDVARNKLARDGAQVIGIQCDLATPDGVDQLGQRIDEVGLQTDISAERLLPRMVERGTGRVMGSGKH